MDWRRACWAGVSAIRLERLAERAGADEDLRRRVKLLLAAHHEDSFLASPAPALGGTIDDPITERPGTVVGPYKLMEQIGEGGMGLVFVAEQQHPVRRKVALKVIKPGMGHAAGDCSLRGRAAGAGLAADSSGLSTYTAFLAGGGTIRQLRAILLNSDEYFNAHGGNNVGFLQGLYSDGLGRPLDGGGQGVYALPLRCKMSAFCRSSTEYLDRLRHRFGRLGTG